MKPLRTPADLVALAAQHAPSRACVTAISENRARVLGGFTPAGGLPCYIVRVRSKRGREWIIAVEIDEQAYRYNVKCLDAVPWACWDGKIRGKRPLIDGEVSVEAAYNRMKAKRASRNVQLSEPDR